jgi:multicomponent Na+:H+ antiporter subunit G
MNLWITAALMWIGAVFMLIAAIGIARLPDTFTRLQAATKAVTLGMASMMLAAATYFADVGVTVRALTTLLFLFATAPIAAHLIGRVAYLVGAEMWQGTQCDELREQHTRPRPEDTAPPGDTWDTREPSERRRSRG